MLKVGNRLVTLDVTGAASPPGSFRFRQDILELAPTVSPLQKDGLVAVPRGRGARPATLSAESPIEVRNHFSPLCGSPRRRVILDKNLLQSALDLRLGGRFTFQQDNNPKHTAMMTKE